MHIGLWFMESGFSRVKVTKWKSCLNGLSFNVFVIGTSPYIVYSENGISGSDIELLDIVAEKYGFIYSLRPERSWGGMDKEGIWKGTVGSVLVIFIVKFSLTAYIFSKR